jgi:hypothetical protein
MITTFETVCLIVVLCAALACSCVVWYLRYDSRLMQVFATVCACALWADLGWSWMQVYGVCR